MARNTSSSVRSSRVIAPDPDQPTGKNLFIDKKRRIIYTSPLLRQPLYLPRYDYKKFNRYRSRFLVALATFMILSTTLTPWFNVPLWVSLLISIAVFAGLEYSYYKFLKTLQPVSNFNPEKVEPTVSRIIPPEMRSKYWVRAILYVILGVLLVVNGYQQNYDTVLILGCWAALLYCLYAAIQLGLALMRSDRA